MQSVQRNIPVLCTHPPLSALSMGKVQKVWPLWNTKFVPVTLPALPMRNKAPGNVEELWFWMRTFCITTVAARPPASGQTPAGGGSVPLVLGCSRPSCVPLIVQGCDSGQISASFLPATAAAAFKAVTKAMPSVKQVYPNTHPHGRQRWMYTATAPTVTASSSVTATAMRRQHRGLWLLLLLLLPRCWDTSCVLPCTSSPRFKLLWSCGGGRGSAGVGPSLRRIRRDRLHHRSKPRRGRPGFWLFPKGWVSETFKCPI